jgi:ankyrin repeat protein
MVESAHEKPDERCRSRPGREQGCPGRGVPHGRLDLLKFLLPCRVSPNAQDKLGQTALMVAAGADLNLIAKNGLTALRFAVDAGAREAARLIKQAGAR